MPTAVDSSFNYIPASSIRIQFMHTNEKETPTKCVYYKYTHMNIECVLCMNLHTSYFRHIRFDGREQQQQLSILVH